MDIKQLNEVIESSSMWSDDWQDDVKGFNMFFHFYNISSLKNDIREMGGLPFEYKETVTWYGEESGQIYGQHVFLLDNYLLAVDFFEDSWDNSSVAEEAYPVIPVVINTSINEQETRYVRL